MIVDWQYKVVKARPAGLFSNFASAIGMLHEAEVQGKLPVVQFDQGPYLDASIGPNWWEYYFQPVSVVPADFVGDDPGDQRQFAQWAGALRYLELARASALVAKYIRPKPEIVAEVDRFYGRHFRDVYVVGVHLRGTDKETGFRLSDSYVLRRLNDVLSEIRVPYKIFVATDESHYLSLLQAVPLSPESHPFVGASWFPVRGLRERPKIGQGCLGQPGSENMCKREWGFPRNLGDPVVSAEESPDGISSTRPVFSQRRHFCPSHFRANYYRITTSTPTEDWIRQVIYTRGLAFTYSTSAELGTTE